jgi:cytochrome c oxidase accessory protein FixG
VNSGSGSPAASGPSKFAFLHPADARGRWSRLRGFVFAALLLVYLVLPWLRIGGRQALLLDIVHRRFAIFGLELPAHDAPLLFLLLAAGAFALCFATALWGRVWCGYACPQTVFIAAVFRRIERAIEGNHLARLRLAQARFSGPWLAKKGLKWAAFVAVALVIAHSFLAYFVGTERLKLAVLQDPKANWTLFVAMLFITAFVLADFAWLRERFCFTLCPYGRFQTVLMDRHSLAIVYDEGRGEPRRGTGAGTGDCVACDLCVQVCPTGIDIRQGVQMECIACTACIDACDSVMAKVAKPAGLIRYDTEAGLRGEPKRTWRARPALYLGFTLAFGGALAAVLLLRRDLDIVPFRAGGAPYQEVRAQGSETLVTNHLRFDLTNRTSKDLEVRVDVAEAQRAQGMAVVCAANPLPLPARQERRVDLFVKFPKTVLDFGKAPVRLTFGTGDGKAQTVDLTLVGPYQ